MLHHVFSCGLFYNAVIISDYTLLIMGLVNWEGSGSTCGLNKILSWYMPGKPEKIHKKNPHTNSQCPAKTHKKAHSEQKCELLHSQSSPEEHLSLLRCYVMSTVTDI
jgi:hypothetical protein